MEARDQKVFSLLQDGVKGLNLDLVEVRTVFTGGTPVLRLVIYSPNGVGHGDCSRTSRMAAQAIEAAQIVPGDFRIEVSSPGTTRTLRERHEFDLFHGLGVRVWTEDEEGNPGTFDGVCEGSGESDTVTIRTESGSITIPWSSVRKARLEPELTAPGATGGREG